MEKNLDTLNASIPRYIIGAQAGISVKGSQKRVDAFCDAALKSRELYKALNEDDITLNEVLDLIQKKKESCRQFKDVTGLSWRL